MAPKDVAHTQSGDDLAAGRQVLETESAALGALSAALDDAFVAAVDLLAGGHGRVIVTGMGKSGHVAHKIAATFASTGTPAFFVHPAEASHGDLGMITEHDVALCFRIPARRASWPTSLPTASAPRSR